MVQIVRFHPLDERRVFFEQLLEKMPVFQKQAQCLVALNRGVPVACLSALVVEGFGGTVSHYGAVEAAAGVLLLQRAKELLRGQGAARVVGPVDNTFWADGGIPLPLRAGDEVFRPEKFLGEPSGNTAFAQHWEWAGFLPLFASESLICPQIFSTKPALQRLERGLASRGEEVRSFDMTHFSEQKNELLLLLRRYREAQPQPLPCEEEVMEAGEEEMESLFDSSYTFFIYKDDRVVGFCFAHPDTFSDKRLIVRAIFTRTKGLGHAGVLVAALHRAAYKNGVQSVIHACVPAGGGWQRLISHHFGGVSFRRYQWFGCELKS
jgi:hypothetical protein